MGGDSTGVGGARHAPGDTRTARGEVPGVTWGGVECRQSSWGKQMERAWEQGISGEFAEAAGVQHLLGMGLWDQAGGS